VRGRHPVGGISAGAAPWSGRSGTSSPVQRGVNRAEGCRAAPAAGQSAPGDRALSLATPEALEVRPAAARATAGAAVTGEVVGFGGIADVALVRLERVPGRVVAVRCAEATLRGAGRRRFALDVPEEAVPTARGQDCTIDYELEAREPLGDGSRATASITVEASRRPHLESGVGPADRLMANAPARHHHLELADADLRGGGRIVGRIHRHGPWASGALAVEVTCVEAWRAHLATLAGVPHWERRLLWSAEATVQTDPDRMWVPFGFDVPAGLPPAVEARALSWRYEITARRHSRFGVGECAVLTPLLFESA
jgi:hypothetical protein